MSVIKISENGKTELDLTTVDRCSAFLRVQRSFQWLNEYIFSIFCFEWKFPKTILRSEPWNSDANCGCDLTSLSVSFAKSLFVWISRVESSANLSFTPVPIFLHTFVGFHLTVLHSPQKLRLLFEFVFCGQTRLHLYFRESLVWKRALRQ